MSVFFEQLRAQQEYLTGLRRAFHQHPELALHEFWTAEAIERELDLYGIPHRRVGATGVLGFRRNLLALVRAAAMGLVGLAAPDPLGPELVIGAVANIAIWGGTGFNMIVLYTSLRAVPSELYDAARIDGCGEIGVFWRIVLPLLRGTISTAAVLSLIGSLKYFDLIWVMTEGGPSHATETVATDIYTTAFRFLQVGYAQAMAMILLIVILLLAVVEVRFLDRRAATMSS